MKLPRLEDANITGKTVFLRADLDAPLSQQTTNNKQQTTILDETRLLAFLPTLKYLLDNGAKVIIAGHLGKPKGIDKSLSLQPITYWLFKEFKIRNLKFAKIGDFEGWKIGPNIFLLENLRFYKGEEENDQEFARRLAKLADIFVNDAFAVCHRNHASIVGIPKLLPHFAGFRLQKEVEVLSSIIDKPKRPLVVIIGGAKLETKLPLVEKMHHFANYVLVGGKIAEEVKVLLRVANAKIRGVRSALLVADVNKDKTDITPKSVENFLQIVSLGKTIVWNGPVGKMNGKWKMENGKLREDTEKGTRELARGIAKSGAYTVVGGGDTIGFLKKTGLLSKFSFISTGGGSMLAFLSGEKLPGLEALMR